MHSIARLIGRLAAAGLGLGLAFVLGGCIASAHPLPGVPGGSFNGGNVLNQSAIQSLGSSAVANAGGAPWGDTTAIANSSPYQSLNQNANIGPFGGWGSYNGGNVLNQSANQSLLSSAAANAYGSPWGDTTAIANSSPYQSLNQNANIGGFGGWWNP